MSLTVGSKSKFLQDIKAPVQKDDGHFNRWLVQAQGTIVAAIMSKQFGQPPPAETLGSPQNMPSAASSAVTPGESAVALGSRSAHNPWRTLRQTTYRHSADQGHPCYQERW